MVGQEKDKIKKKKKKILVGILVGGFVMYLAFSMYFTNRFYFGSSINSISVSGKTVDEVNDELSLEVDDYTLEVKGRGGLKEEIKGEDIGIYYEDLNSELQTLKDNQNPLGWINSIFSNDEHEVEALFNYDKDLLNKKIDSLQCLNEVNMKKPQDPKLNYSNYKYEIIPEESGQLINKDKLINEVSKAIINGYREIDLEKLGCYENPKYNLSSKEVVNAKSVMDKYVDSKITLKFMDKSQYIDGETISKWIMIDSDYNVALDNSKITDYIRNLTLPYSTIGKTRSFKASTGNIVNVSGGDYGRKIDNTKYVEDLIAAIKQGDTTTKEYTISQESIGNNYVEINLTKQHIWCYKNGNLVTEGKIVTGDLSRGWGTPQGVYKLKSRETNRILRGEGYASPVTFWMPFNGGIGLHDASWRSTFGGSIYKNNGSHGCINLSYSVASAIYNNINVGDPVICYFE